MAGNMDTLREGYEAFGKGDIETATGNWTDDFTWQGPEAEGLPGGGEHSGKEEALKVLQEAVGSWDEFELSADEFFEDGDTIVVLGHQKVKKGDQSAELPIVHIWRFEGDQACRLQLLTDTLQGARMQGIA